ncbi:MAG: capsule assembly Wzi family protein [Candidatus Acidiferrum sp.]
MKAANLARYTMLIKLTMAASGLWAAQSEQLSAADAPVSTPSSAIEIPAAKTLPVEQRSNNLLLAPERASVKASKRFFSDQKDIWTSPARLQLSDAEWLVPAFGVTAGALFTDKSLSRSLPNGPGAIRLQNEVRTGGVTALAAASGGLFLWSLRTRDPHERETGLLASEAMVDSLVAAEGLKFLAARERPDQGTGDGRFFQGGNSWPSSHAAAAWAAAGILAHEYPGPMTKLLAYGLAATVSFASVGSKQHFASDALVGSGIGWLISGSVYRKRHDAGLGGSYWDPLGSLFHDQEFAATRYPGSAYVPLDSWIYPAFDRLAALGYVDGAFQGTKPWTREECARLLLDADQSLEKWSASAWQTDEQVRALLLALHREFAREEESFSGTNRSAEMDSAYTRVLSAAGTVLNNGYLFGQTLAYDFGRPFRQGSNVITGASASATYGSLFFYINGEYQQSPSSPAFTNTEIQFIAERDRTSPSPDTPFASIHQFALLDAYAGTNIHGWQVTFGNQSLSWGPGAGGSLLLSDNAAPFPMLRVAPSAPFEVPGLSRILGPFHVEQFFGRLDGFAVLSQPWIYGQKISFKPFRSLEFAYGRTTLIGGSGHPLTAGNFFGSLVGRVDSAQNSVPGDSRTAVEWTWRLPGVHDWVTFYGELEDDDDPIPLQNLTKSVLRPGLYFPRLPLLPKWDFHFEWTTSTSPGRASFQNHGDLNYWNLAYPDGYTNDGNLMGNVVGREGVTLQTWARYWISSRQTLDLSWKQSRVLSDYVPGGGKWQDFDASYYITSHSGIYVKSLIQFEHISSYPLLFSGSRNNLVASVELGFRPAGAHHRNASGSLASPGVNRTAEEQPNDL